MSICLVFQLQYPWDIRVEKMINSLNKAKYKVDLVCRNEDGLPVREQVNDYFAIHRLPGGAGNVSRKILNFPAFFSPVWIGKILSTIRKSNSKLVIVRDLPLGPAALIAAKLTKLPVVLDMAENYPAMIKDTWKYRGPRWSDYAIRNPYLLKKLEEWLLPRLDAIWVVSEASRKRVAGLLGDASQPVRVIGNTPRLDEMQKLLPHPLAAKMSEHSGLVILYTGGLEECRGLETVIKAMSAVARGSIDPMLVIVGEGSSQERLRSLSRELGVASRVLMPGWIDHAFLPALISEADVCVVPHYVTEHTDTTLPNKIFDYMALSKPVIASHAASLSDIVNSYKCGLTYHDTDQQELACALRKINNADLRASLGLSGRAAVWSEFNWAQDEKTLLEAVGQLITSNKFTVSRRRC